MSTKINAIIIELPWPDKRLSPNARSGWRAKAEAAKDAKKQAYWMTGTEITWNVLEAIERWSLSIIFCPPDRRRRDLDNLHNQCKPYQDGVCDKLGIDDSQIKRVVLEWSDVSEGGKVILKLEKMNEKE